MNEQLDIFAFLYADLINNDLYPTKYNKKQIAQRISELTGLDFTRCEDGYYRASKNKALIDFHFSTYADSNKMFIGVGWSYKTMGGGCPCDTLNEACEKIKQYMERIEKERAK